MKTETSLEYKVNNTNADALPVIVVAAGNFTRMKGVNKQLLEIGGLPVIVRTLMAFENSDCISNIILVVRADDIFSMQLLTERYNISKLSDIVCGGSNRQESVKKGLSRVGDSENKVLIHDGARPLVTEKIIADVVKGLERFSAVTCGVPVVDTVKKINSESKVIQTVDRSDLVAVQTPQGVNVGDYKKALERVGDLSEFTDDMSIMEAAGYEVLITEGSRSNIKITTKSDIALATALLEEELCE